MENNELPSRVAVRILIFKSGKLLLLKQLHHQTGAISNYGFPGGGVEDGQTPEEACAAECLEEVGVKIKNLRNLELVDEKRGTFFYGERAKRFGGMRDCYYRADYDGLNEDLLGSQGDAHQYEWMCPKEAIKTILSGPASIFNKSRIEAILKCAS